MLAPSLGDARSRALVALLRFLHGPVIVTSFEHHVRLLLPAMKLMLAAGNTLHPWIRPSCAAVRRRPNSIW